VGISGATFGAAATFDGVTSVTNATAATSKTDGALVVTGGVGVSGALFGSTADLDGVVTLTDTTEATSSTTGALKAAGGVGIAKDVYVGERAYVTGVSSQTLRGSRRRPTVSRVIWVLPKQSPTPQLKLLSARTSSMRRSWHTS
jgi:hypothetical protein